MERIPRPGEFYRHFKDKLYQIVAVATHSETGETMVVYQALYGDFMVYVRPLELFLSPVDKEKYPDVEQEWRFERVERSAAMVTAERRERIENGAASQRNLSPLVLPFVEADTCEQRLELLAAMQGKVEQADLDVLYVALDLPQRGGSVGEQLNAMEKYLQMQLRFEGTRLR